MHGMMIRAWPRVMVLAWKGRDSRKDNHKTELSRFDLIWYGLDTDLSSFTKLFLFFLLLLFVLRRLTVISKMYTIKESFFFYLEIKLGGGLL